MSYLLDQPRQIALKDPDRLGAHASGRYLGGGGPDALTAWVAFDDPQIRGNWAGTDCLILYALPGVEGPDLGKTPEVLERSASGVTLLLPRPVRADKSRASLKLEVGGKESFFNFDPSAWLAPWIVLRLPYVKGKLETDGEVWIEW